MTIKKTVTSKRKYGTYPGAISDEELQKLKNCSEIDLYFNIKATENFIKTSKHAVGICPFLDEFQYSLEYYVMQSKRFGVELKEPDYNEHVFPTESYEKWYSWWDNYINALSDNEYSELRIALRDGKDISKYHPNGSWKD